ncbi:MAG: tRNA (adenosine(37)-N6)-threonylcarbamoyltransferase complex ATPase subunit type 1 TsaE [Bacteroidota bacterium]|nr:tRNA (adenosine(37)-N6)-threonylcarbamoyltransferase complex ATPase subunit type 1 TsaE [Bacteroidota bacterium]MDP4229531.1 tRNA (adenosine(37)-N6)-threonylcarbamoyltransferase complex ATPase subunit type 1 TsaE [Bacteroidota bacterium]MDP4236541.1 tRNA (adenosine(37)-N6)-threonylcarbamoyltransferase complex ATPase subunit type 1 TsaE [Bacteroidota bacterium]
MDQEVISRSAAETVALGKEFAAELHSGSLVLLRGELGAGKTQFTKGIAEYFGLHDHEISSPTYALVNEYDLSSSGSISKLYHLDCYRFEKPEELIELGAREYLYPTHGITVIEWPERIEAYLPKKRIEVMIEILSQNVRKISLFYSANG